MTRRPKSCKGKDQIRYERNFYKMINEYIEQHRREMIDLWEELVNIDSGTDNAAGVMEVCTLLRKTDECRGHADEGHRERAGGAGFGRRME